MDQLQIVSGCIPTIKQDRASLQRLVTYCRDQHLAKVLIFGLAIGIWCVDTMINGTEIALLPGTMDEIDDPNVTYQTRHRSAILPFDQINLSRVVFLLDTIVQNQIGLRTIVDEWTSEFP